MEPAALPLHEGDRLHALASLFLLDTPSEERYDRIARLVAAHFGEPIAAINLIAADRQWSKAHVGGLEREMPRQRSFCAHTLLANDLLVIEDTLADPRFCDSPLVTGPPQVRFYAGAPLHSPDGHAVGTLCLMGPDPHGLDPDRRRQLQDFAALAERELAAVEVCDALSAEQRSQARFRAAAEANLDPFLVMEGARNAEGTIGDFTITFANSRAEQVIAVPRAQIIGRRLGELLPAAGGLGLIGKYARVMETGIVIDEEIALGRTPSLPALAHHRATPMAEGVAVTLRDITARRSDDEAAAHTNARLKEAVQDLERRTRDIMLLNELGELLLSCRTIGEVGDVVALSLRTLLPRTMGILYLENAAGAPLASAASWGGYPLSLTLARDSCWALRRQRVHYVSVGKSELFCRHSVAEHRCEGLCIPLRSQGRILGLLHVMSLRLGDTPTFLEETQRQLAMTVSEWTSLALANLMLQAELRQQAVRDPLTSLYNRRYFEELAPQIIADAAADSYPVGVIAIDIDHFKQVNDRYGHATGDQVIHAVAQILRSGAGGGSIACRVGGEEFLVVLPRVACDEAAAVAERLRLSAVDLHRAPGPSIPPVTISAGVAAFPQSATQVSALVAAADAALYQAKAGGRNQVVIDC